MTRHKGIIAYGTEEDRQKLSVLSSLANQSGSEMIVSMIRARYREVFGTDCIVVTQITTSN